MAERAALTTLLLRASAALMLALVALFLLHNYLVHWRGWPEWSAVAGGDPSSGPGRGWMQALSYATVLVVAVYLVRRTPARSLRDDARMYSGWAAFVIRAAFWGALLIGLVDMLISFLRVEGFLQVVAGEYLATQLGRPVFRGTFVHYPLLAAALVIARFARAPGFIWLTLLVVVAEFQVVLSRFVFSYEQAFMGDLVRFWYAALFLFASAYTLLHEGHVRVDVLYANFTARGKAWANAAGAVLLGLPVCWTILLYGMAGKGASIVSPLLGFEISQSGYGMYVKYLMAGFLLVFAVSMAIQFIAAFLDNAATLRGERQPAA
ncbi:MAG: TRAP transporter small permease subunit [Gammaproteobacteria bacterium]|nr:TRAP transporter small permease subunit [Gammaproteobacteria bacterium]